MDITVLLSGRLRLEGYGRGKPKNGDGTFPLNVKDGSTVRQIIRNLGVPSGKVVMIMLNGRMCELSATVRSNDRVILIPQDVAVLWRALGRLNMGAESVCDF
jgi:hypothetical protein